MGRRILSFGVAATHGRITALSAFGDVVSMSDFDAFVFEPHVLRTVVNLEVLSRRQAEIRDLVQRKGGLLLCILRPPCQMQTNAGGVQDVLNLFDLANPQLVAIVKSGLRMGTATKWGLVGPRKGVTFGCVQSLGNRLRPEAFLESERGFLEGVGVLTVAENSAGWPVSFEFACGPGRLCFVPVPVDVTDGQLGAAIARMVEAHFGGSVEVELPEWVAGVSVPGAAANDARIAELEKQKEEVAAELARLSEEKSQLLNFRALLFGYGKSLLEPVVRQSLREKRARGFEYCLLPTSDLFAAVCAVLERSGDEALKSHLRGSILSTVGSWRFGGLSQAVRVKEEGEQEPGTKGDEKK